MDLHTVDLQNKNSFSKKKKNDLFGNSKELQFGTSEPQQKIIGKSNKQKRGMLHYRVKGGS